MKNEINNLLAIGLVVACGVATVSADDQDSSIGSGNLRTQYSDKFVGEDSASRRLQDVNLTGNDIIDNDFDVQYPDWESVAVDATLSQFLVAADVKGRKKAGGKQKKGKQESSLSQFSKLGKLIKNMDLQPSEKDCAKEFAPTYDDCAGMVGIAMEVMDYITYSQCSTSPAIDPNNIYNIFTSCDALLYESLPEVQAFPEVFCPVQHFDANYDIPATNAAYPDYAPLGENKYAWAADYNSTCGLGLTIHSGGTGSLLSRELTAPTMTFRDADGVTVFHDFLYRESGTPMFGVGVRSSLIVDCIGDLITIVVANFGLPGQLTRMTVDVSGGPEPFSAGFGAFGSYVTKEISSPSVRAMYQLGCYITYAPLNDIQDLDSLTLSNQEQPQLLTYNWCYDGTEPEPEPVRRHLASAKGPHASSIRGRRMDSKEEEVNSIEEEEKSKAKGGKSVDAEQEEAEIEEVKTKAMEGYNVWDFECKFGICWVNLFSGEKDKDKEAGIDLFPELYYFRESELNKESSLLEDTNESFGANIVLYPVQLDLDIDTSALALEPIDEDLVMACTQSGWIYYTSATGDVNEYTRRKLAEGRRKLKEGNRKLAGPLAEYLEFDLNGIELSEGQECNICSASSGECEKVGLPEQTTTSAYVWQVESCGDYMFIGTLDVANVVGPLVLYQVQEMLDLDLSASPALNAWVGAILTSAFFGGIVTPYDYGFDVWYLNKAELLLGSEPEFRPVTIGGFRKEQSAIDYGPLWPAAYPFTPLTAIEDGVRQLVCQDDKKLVVGTATYGASDSSSTWILDLECNPPGSVAAPDLAKFDPSIIPETGLAQLLLDPDLMAAAADIIARIMEDPEAALDEALPTDGSGPETTDNIFLGGGADSEGPVDLTQININLLDGLTGGYN